LGPRIERARRSGFAFLRRAQQPAGCWNPLWFGNQHHPQEENPVYGTSRVLLAYGEFDRVSAPEAQHGLSWLRNVQLPGGGWGAALADGPAQAGPASVEETALAVEALILDARQKRLQDAAIQGLEWLMAKIESDQPLESSPIGFYFAKLWYYEETYPLVFTVSALGRALREFAPPRLKRPAAAPLADA
jgi:squalene-hopene/tetraprenyl-beta-curcumene cyclase